MKNPRLQELVNLVIVCGDHGNPSKDKEELAELKKMFDLIEQYNLNGHVRWISAQMNHVRNAELCRYICDTKGAFVQAFGLTVIEAMTCGLPTFATALGGPAEIIVNGVSGYHIDRYKGDKASALLVEFYEKCQGDSSHWTKILQGRLQRIEDKYTWKLYSERLMTLTGVYGFWWSSGSTSPTSRGARPAATLRCCMPSSTAPWPAPFLWLLRESPRASDRAISWPKEGWLAFLQRLRFENALVFFLGAALFKIQGRLIGVLV